ncbi:MAG: two-component sensor histidine kinase [Deltaproteobacteria bacterium]|nr:MAG: two-component sensor histidine kinase [Deltaproteobacteria bacterium]
MSLLEKMKPKFWEFRENTDDPSNFRHIWLLMVLLTLLVAIAPLVSMTMIDNNVSRKSAESEILLRTSRLVSNTRRSVSFFLGERKAALKFVVYNTSFNELNDPMELALILESLKKGFGGFVDIGVIDASGRQKNYTGPYSLEGVNYSGEEWFREVVERGNYISNVFMGFRQVPHLVVAVRHDLPDDSFYVVRATLDTERFNDLLFYLEVSGQGDAFIVNQEGMLQTPSRYHGKVLEKISDPIPSYSEKTEVFERKNVNGEVLIVGYAYIAESPFILMIIKQKDALMDSWHTTRMEIAGFLMVSIAIIFFAILGGATYLSNKIYVLEQNRDAILHEVEYSNKMASLGELAAGVAHEINNPLAIINEKAGLIKDIFTFKEQYSKDEKLMNIANVIISSVERCASITRRLLNFARHIDINIRPLCLREVLHEVLGFLEKEAEYRSISVSVEVPDNMPQLESDRGKLQEIFLNLVNNAFVAMKDEGKLDISVKQESEDSVAIIFMDDGCGISEENICRIFEPFFSTKKKAGGTGLGLSITYGLVEKMGGTIGVKSELGKGTTFTVMLPLKTEQKE